MEEYFVNLGWVCVKSIERNTLLDILDVSIRQTIKWQDGYDLLIDSMDENMFLYYKIDNWDFLINKQIFIDVRSLKTLMTNLSLTSKEVHAFAIDAWSNFYCYSKSENGINTRFWQENENGIINEGDVTSQESEITEIDKANRILSLSNNISVPFKVMEAHVAENAISLLKAN